MNKGGPSDKKEGSNEATVLSQESVSTKTEKDMIPLMYQSPSNEKEIDNGRCQNEIKQRFQHSKSPEIFGFLARFGSLTTDQISAHDFCNLYLQEPNDCGHLETQIRRGESRIHRLSDRAFQDPEKDSSKSNDADSEELSAMMTETAASDFLTGGKCRQWTASISNKRKSDKVFLDPEGACPKPNDTVRQEISSVMTEITMHSLPKGEKRRRRKLPIRNKREISKRRKKSCIGNTAEISASMQMVFQNEDLLGKIVGYLDAKTIMFAMTFVSKRIQSHLTHEHAVRCAMADQRGSRRMSHLKNLIQQGSIYTPSPMRIMRLGIGKRCERCNIKKVNNLNNLGLFLCRRCTQGIVKEVKLHREQPNETNKLIRVAIGDDRCAKLVSWRKNGRAGRISHYSLYSETTAFIASGGEKAGPLVSVTNLILTSPKTFDEILEEAYSSDLHSGKIPSILQACERFVPKYKFVGILNHLGPDTGSNYSSEWMVKVEWENGEQTWEFLIEIAKDAPEYCYSYASSKGLLDKDGWRWLQN